MATQLEELQTQLALQNSKAEEREAELKRQLNELAEKHEAARIQLGLATAGTAVPNHLVADYTRRRAGGLTHDQAKECAMTQYENDLRVKAAEEKAARDKAEADLLKAQAEADAKTKLATDAAAQRQSEAAIAKAKEAAANALADSEQAKADEAKAAKAKAVK